MESVDWRINIAETLWPKVRSSFTEALHNLYKKYEPSGRDMQTWAISI